MDDRELDKILKARAVPPMRSNLEHRILQASFSGDKNRSVSGGNSIMAIFTAILDGLVLPKPALSMALVLVFGFSVWFGVGGYSSGASEASTNIDADAYFLAAETIGYGDIL